MAKFERKKFEEKVKIEVVDAKLNSYNLDENDDLMAFQIKFSGLFNFLCFLTLDGKLKTIDLSIDRVSPSPNLSKLIAKNYKTFIRQSIKEARKSLETKSELDEYKKLEKQLAQIKDQMESLKEENKTVEEYVKNRDANIFRASHRPSNSHPADGC